MKLLATRYSLNSQKGITIYLAMLVMGGALAVALSVSTIFVGEFKISGETVNSLKAVYVADSIMEEALYQTRPEGTYVCGSLSTKYAKIDGMNNTISYSSCPSGLASNAACETKIQIIQKTDSSAPSSCRDSSACDCTKVTARGSFGSINRAMEIVYPNL